MRREGYRDAPASWYVIITDVRGSTRAIEQGRYRDVNALGVASIIAVTNAVPDLEVPYVFGGDGATLLVPGSRLEMVAQALRSVRELAVASFDLELRVARVSVAELRTAGYAVRVERYQLSRHIALGMFSGSGFAAAESWAKDEVLAARYEIEAGPSQADFEGFECRWQPMKSQRGEVVCLLVVALGDDEAVKQATYQSVLSHLERVLEGGVSVPITRPSMRPLPTNGDYSVEAKVRSGSASGSAFDRAKAHARKKTLIGRVLMAFRREAGGFDGKTYRDEFIENSDFRKFDETLRMVLDLTPLESAAVERWLLEQSQRGVLAFGIHRSSAAIATCMIKAYKGNHVHFVDGADGGYALAARGLKEQLKRAPR